MKAHKSFDKNGHPDLFKDQDGFKRYSRRFNIDMAPKVLFSRSESVDKLLESGAAQYFEFNNVSDNYFYNKEAANESQPREARVKEEMVKIPFSKSDIFTNTVLTLYEKRQLVKFIEICLQASDTSSKSVNSTHVYDKELNLGAD